MSCLRLKPIIHISCVFAAIIVGGLLKADPDQACKVPSASPTEVSETAELSMHATLSAAGFHKFAAVIEASGLVNILEEE